MVKNPPDNTGDAGNAGSIPGSGRSPGEGNDNQYSCLENPMDRGAWRATVHGVSHDWVAMKCLNWQVSYLTVWRPEVQNGLHWSNQNVSRAFVTSRGDSVSLSFSVSRSWLCSLAQGSLSPFPRPAIWWDFSHDVISMVLYPLPPSSSLLNPVFTGPPGCSRIISWS